MRSALKYLLAPALAAGAVVTVEVLRTLVFGATALGGAGQVLAFAFAVLGLLGFPLWLGGVLLTGLVEIGGRGWRFGRGDRPPLAAADVGAWVLVALVVLAAVVIATQAATIQFVKMFRKPVYQGLGAGLVAAVTLTLCAVLVGPLVGLLRGVLARLSRALPAWADPLTPRGAALWIVSLVVVGNLLAPVVLPELHTVDLRPARLALFAVFLGVAAAWGVSRLRRPAVGLAVGFALAATYGAAFGWSAVALGGSQSRLLALDRDTLLAGPVAARLGRLGDGDGDGVSRAFAGGDCDDSNPNVRPGVYDPPGDGVDQNCTGADLDLKTDPVTAPERLAPGPQQPWNVVVVTIDALRADMVAPQMPRLRELAKESVVYTNAYSHGAATYWSLPALMLSKPPSRLWMGRDQTPVAQEQMLTEVLKDAGWHTALFANVTVFFVRGLRQGTYTANYETSHFTVHGAKPGSAHLTDGVLTHIDKWRAGELKPSRDRFYVWAHYYDPHDPYFEVPDYPAEGSSDRARYEALVRYTDAHVGRLVDGLKERGLWDRTLFVVTADHGDEFGDHGHRFHGSTLYEEMTHVPLMLHVPGIGARTLDVPIGQMELAPTILDLLGVATPKAYLGRSRVEEVRTGKPAEVQPVYLEVFPDSNYGGHQVAVRLGALKLIYRISANYFELYDLAEDPGETRNLYDTHLRAEELRALLLEYADHHLYHLGQGKTGARLPAGVPKAKPAPKKRKSKPGKRKQKPKKRAPKPPPRRPPPGAPT